MFGLSDYVMRADYQKPRKDCIRRGLEKLSEVMQREPISVEARFGGHTE